MYSHDLFPGNQVCVPDDKDRKQMRKVDMACYHALLLCYAVCCETWKLSCLTVHEANVHIQRALRTLAPSHLQSWLGAGLACEWVPYAYGTIKSKWHSSGAHLCAKPGHSCVRKVVVYCRWPFRHRWRLVVRVTSSFGNGAMVSKFEGLKYATSNLLLDCHALEHEGLVLQVWKW